MNANKADASYCFGLEHEDGQESNHQASIYYFNIPGRRPAFRVFHRVWIFLMSVTPSSDHAKRKSGRSGGSGLFPAIKTALVDVCHEIRMGGITILKGYGELGLG